MRWSTRRHCHVDRAASAWLIPFVQASTRAPCSCSSTIQTTSRMTRRRWTVQAGVELGHHGDYCSFETMLDHFGLADPVLWDLAQHRARSRSRR